MKLSNVFIIAQSLWTMSLAAKLRESASHTVSASLPDPSVTYYNSTDGYPNQDYVKSVNPSHVDPNAPDYFESRYDFRKIAADYIKNTYPDIEISDYSNVVYGKNSLLVTYHNYQTVNNIPILNSDITITINGETGLIINESFLTMNDLSSVETSDISNADQITRQKSLLEAINVVIKQYELSDKELNFNDVVFIEDAIEKKIIIKKVPFTSDKKIVAKMGYYGEEEDNKKTNLKLIWNIQFNYEYQYYTLQYDIPQNKVLVLYEKLNNFNVIPYDNMGTRNGNDWYFKTIDDPSIKNASPNGWNKVGNVNYKVTMGNNARVFSDIEKRETVADFNQNFNFEYDENLSDEENKNASVTNTFYIINIIHDIYFNLGFTEEKGNFQVENYSGKGVGNDPMTVLIHNYVFGTDEEEAKINDPVRKYFREYCSLMCTYTPSDGQSPIIHMASLYYATSNHGIIHEYTHAVTQRMTSYGRNNDCFTQGDSGEMNEALSEFFASAIAFKKRNDPAKYGDVYKVTDKDRPKHVHAFGEFFVAALNDAFFLVCKYYRCDPNMEQEFGNMELYELPYNVIFMTNVLNALSHVTCKPTYTDLRNAIIEEAANNYIIRDDKFFKCLLWIGFAKRGLGYNANKTFEYRNGKEHYINNYDIPEECSDYKFLL
ncbi:hypothetical protein PIROE2DRAFT_14019 [Piromyces sp. E2]|nr:hypothetical protein PIROE2DRAFT_14019 [Piromyces sp. E2]|eukprot:OUM60271.1 hypothetical protein PIROE2DRAFT_14019 [Piromyces sp. E2]